MNKIRIWLSHPLLLFIVPLLAVSLVLPSLGTGLNLDDNLYRLAMKGEKRLTPSSSSPLNLYCIMDGNPVETLRLMNTGLIAWTNPEKVKMFFLRPVSALTHWLDFFLWPSLPLLMHFQNARRHCNKLMFVFRKFSLSF